MNKTIIIIGSVFAVLVLVFIYFVIMILWPEWVGISGKDTKKTLESHEDKSKKT